MPIKKKHSKNKGQGGNNKAKANELKVESKGKMPSNLEINLDDKDKDVGGPGLNSKLKLASGAVQAGILASEEVANKARQNTTDNMEPNDFNDNVIAIPADMDSTRGIVGGQEGIKNLKSESKVDSLPISNNVDYLDSVATSDASAILLKNSENKTSDFQDNNIKLNITSRNEVKNNDIVTPNQAVLTEDINSTGAHTEQKTSSLVLTENEPIKEVHIEAPALTSTLAPTGELKPVLTDTLSDDKVVLGPGGNAGDVSINKGKHNSLSKTTGIVVASTAGVISTAAAVAANRCFQNSHSNDSNRLSQGGLSNAPISHVKGSSSLDMNYKPGPNGIAVKGIPIDLEIAEAGSASFGKIVDINNLPSNNVNVKGIPMGLATAGAANASLGKIVDSNKLGPNSAFVRGIPMNLEVAEATSLSLGHKVDVNALIEEQSKIYNHHMNKDVITPLKMDKDDSKSSATSSHKGEKKGTRRSSSMLASAALTAAGALATSIFASKASKKNKEKKNAMQEEMDKSENIVKSDTAILTSTATQEAIKEKEVLNSNAAPQIPPVVVNNDSGAVNVESVPPAMVVTPSNEVEKLDRNPMQSPMPIDNNSSEIEAHGIKASQAFNSNAILAGAATATAGVAAAGVASGPAMTAELNPNPPVEPAVATDATNTHMVNGNNKIVTPSLSKESDVLPHTSNEIQNKESPNMPPFIPVAVTATQASAQVQGYNSVKEKKSYDKNPTISKTKSATASLRKLFNRLSFRKKDKAFMDEDM